MTVRWLLILISSALFLFSSGCAEGPFWRSGKYVPWARNKWAEEAQIADTLFTRKQRMTESVQTVMGAPIDQQEKVAAELSEISHRDSVLLMRLHAVKLLGQMNCPTAMEALADASRDYNTDIRIAAIKAWETKPAENAIPQLQEMIGSDTNVDVRLAATRAVGKFSGSAAVSALGLALNDADPALQIRATESLQAATGESLGRDVVAWQDYVKQFHSQTGGSELDAGDDISVAERPRGAILHR